MMKFGVRKHAIKTDEKSTKLAFWSKPVFFRYVQKCQILNSNGQMATNFNLKPMKHSELPEWVVRAARLSQESYQNE